MKRQNVTRNSIWEHVVRVGVSTAIVLAGFILSGCGGDPGTPPPASEETPRPSKSLPALYYTMDANGDTLYSVVKAHYAKYFSQSGSVCRETYNWQLDEWVQVEIAGCVINIFQGLSSSILTDADRLNGIDFKGTAFIEGTAFRINSTGTWEEWRTFYRGSFAPPVPFQRKAGVFELQPDPGFSKIKLLP